MAITTPACGKCGICGSSHSRVVYGRIRNTRFQIRRCEGCGVEFLDPQLTLDEIQDLYSADYYCAWGMSKGEDTSVAAMKKATFRDRIEDLKRYVSSGSILDVGTATGFFLEAASAAGFEPYGVEISEYAGGIAREKFGVARIHIGTLESAPFRAGMFDAMAMTDLLEHVPDPIDTLRRARDLLRPGGMLMITTPDTDSLSRTIMGAKWMHYKVEHLFYLNARALKEAASRSGFQVAMCRPARKVLTLRYIENQMAVYRHWALSPITSALGRLLRPWASMPFRVRTGEMVAILAKPGI